MTDLTNRITEDDVRFIRFNVTTHSSNPVTLKRQGFFEKKGWRKWIAILLNKPTGEWWDLSSEY